MRFSLLGPPGQSERITGTVVASLMPGWWIVEDTRGRRYRAASDALWRKGDMVAVVGGQIVGRSGRQESPAIYEV